MEGDTLEVVKLVFEVACAAAAIYGFKVAREDWRQSQRWRKSEELERIIDRFETNPACRLACTLLDWTERKTVWQGQPFCVTNQAALEALGLHDVDNIGRYNADAAQLREALDGLLSFFVRLGGALESGFVDVDPTKAYFRYWVERLVTYDRHTVPSSEEPNERVRVARYIANYSDLVGIARLCDRLAVDADAVKQLVDQPVLEELPPSSGASRVPPSGES